jgi:hypothetical protein
MEALMAVWKMVETVYNATVIMAYVSAGLWTIAAIVNIIRCIKKRKRGNNYEGKRPTADGDRH